MCVRLSAHTESVGTGNLKTLRAQDGLFSFSQPSACLIIQIFVHTLPLLDFLLCYSATYLHLILFSPLLLSSMCYTETPHVFLNTRTHTHTCTLACTHTPSRTPNIPLRSDEMQCRMCNNSRQCCHSSLLHLKARNTLSHWQTTIG